MVSRGFCGRVFAPTLLVALGCSSEPLPAADGTAAAGTAGTASSTGAPNAAGSASGGVDSSASGGVADSVAGAGGVSGEIRIDDPDLIAGTAYDVTIAECAAFERRFNHTSLCDRSRLLFVRRANAGLEVGYVDGDQLRTAALTWSRRAWRTDRSLVLVSDEFTTEGQRYPLVADSLAFAFIDSDDDGRPDSVRASGSGIFDDGGDDYSLPSAVTVTVSGPADHAPPELALTGDGWRQPLGLTASEPLAPGATASVRSAEDRVVPATALERLGTVPGFTVQDDLPTGSEWVWSVSGTDMGGNSVERQVTAIVGEPWTPLDDGGFEGEAPFQVVGHSVWGCDWNGGAPGARTSVGSIPAIAGDHSFLVPFDDTVEFYVKRPNGADRVRLTVRMLYTVFGIESVTVSAVTRRGTQTVAVQTSSERAHAEKVSTGDPAYPLAGPPEELELVLPEPGDDVFVRVEAPCRPESSSAYSVGAFVDSLRIE